MPKKFTLSCVLCSALFLGVQAQETSRWQIAPEGGIVWQVGQQGLPHSDHVELSGKRVSTVLRYGVTAHGQWHINKSLVWPTLRTIPDNTHAALMRRFGWLFDRQILVDGRPLGHERIEQVILDGILSTNGVCAVGRKNDSVRLKRSYFPSTQEPLLVERYTIYNLSNKELDVEIPTVDQRYTTPKDRGTTGAYQIVLSGIGSGTYRLAPGDSLDFGATIGAYRSGESLVHVVPTTELKKRQDFVAQMTDRLVLETPNAVIDQMFALSKIRACESIFSTQAGLLHSPGGESYYAAIWANDQAEYINPYFPFVGYENGNVSAKNSFDLFARYMNDDYRHLPSSVISEGRDIWAGAGDRGDAAMIAYGASRYALALGDKAQAEALWPLIEWCLEYCRRQVNEQGVVASDSDELEGRFPAGKANLCTSSLYYDALLSGAYLAKDLGLPGAISAQYLAQAKRLRTDIERYFGATVEGFDTYAYYQGNDLLRSWICIPLTVGIDQRAQGTIDALFSPKLWTENGLLTQSSTSTFWDRSTLYALRGLFQAGATQKAIEALSYYSTRRLLGQHVPYAIEAWPEGEQRHLSAESALYGRIITEGLFGIRPTGLHSFACTPRLPDGWERMALRQIGAFGTTFDLEVARSPKGQINITTTQGGKRQSRSIESGATIQINLPL